MSNDRHRLLMAARRLLPSRADAEDAVQDTYVRALTAFDGACAEPAWMYTVLRNIAIDRLRRQRLAAEHSDAETGQVRSSEELLKLRADCESALRHLLERTSLIEAAALLLRDVFEFDYADIAQLIRKNEPATRQFLQRARTRTRRPDASGDVEEIHVRWCWQAIEARNPARLFDLIQVRGSPSIKSSIGTVGSGDARGHSTLVQVNGRYALALMLDGVVLCVVPLGAQSASEVSGVETC